MLNVPWTCSRCLSRAARSTLNRPFLRSVTTASESDISPVLLRRAGSLAAEHAQLSTQLADSFDTKIAKRAGELASITQVLQEWNKANESLRELRSLAENPETDAELRSLALEDLEGTKGTLPSIVAQLKQSLIPRDPFADLPCLLEIRPGAGGHEAGLFAAEVLRMYVAFFARRGLRNTILKHEVEEADSRLIEAVVEVQSDGAYDLLRTESGVHRVQRVPATETKGRTHTSAVSVMVLPNFPEREGDGVHNFEDPNSDYYIAPSEVRVEKMRAGGAGGQHVNKTESAIRLTHIPTGIVVNMQESRSQLANRKNAFQILRAKLAKQRQEAREQEAMELRRSIGGGVSKLDRSDKVRTYNYNQSRCTDHRSGATVHNLTDILEGGEDLETVMDSVRVWLADQAIETMLVEEAATKEKPAKRRN